MFSVLTLWLFELPTQSETLPFTLIWCFFTFGLMQLLGPLLSAYKYQYDEEYLRISVRFLSILPMPGFKVARSEITGAKRVPWAMNASFLVLNFVSCNFISPFNQIFGVGVRNPGIVPCWGSIWKAETNTLLSLRRENPWWILYPCVAITVTPEEPTSQKILANSGEISPAEIL